MRERRQLTLPAAAKRSPLFWAVSVVVHILAVYGLIKGYSGFRELRDQRRAILVVDMFPPTEVVEEPPPPRGRPMVAPSAPATAVPAVSVAPVEPVVAGGDANGVVGGRPGGRGLAGLARAGDSRLYAPPRYIPHNPGRSIDMDSAMRGTLLAMADQLDSMNMIDSMGYRRSPYATPSWVVERNGKKYGIDQNAIHLGSFSIPTALLALLPMPQGNIDQARANARIADMRSEILRAAARSEAEADFRRAVAQIRERRQRERDEQRARERQRGDERPIN